MNFPGGVERVYFHVLKFAKVLHRASNRIFKVGLCFLNAFAITNYGVVNVGSIDAKCAIFSHFNKCCCFHNYYYNVLNKQKLKPYLFFQLVEKPCFYFLCSVPCDFNLVGLVGVGVNVVAASAS